MPALLIHYVGTNVELKREWHRNIIKYCGALELFNQLGASFYKGR